MRSLALAAALVSIANAAPLQLAGTIPMPGVKGRIDHLAVDVAGRRLFLAALGNDTVEVFDLARMRHAQSVPGFGEPQGLLYVAATRKLFVANGSADRVDVLDGDSLKPSGRAGKLPDADNLRLDPERGAVVVGYGTGALRFMDPATAQMSKEVALSGHPEGFQLERQGTRAFVNILHSGYVEVVDRQKAAVVARWDLGLARSHFPMALDEGTKRLFVGTRLPARALVFDTTSGKVTQRLETCGDSDDLFYDGDRRRLYVVCGEGKVDVFADQPGGGLSREAGVETSAGARTGLFVPELRQLFVAAPARGGDPARLLIFEAR